MRLLQVFLFLLSLSLSLAEPLCTVSFCSLHGAHASCTTHGQGMTMVTTCSTWHVLSATDTDPPCEFTCLQTCPADPRDRLIASDGSLICSNCALQRKSCDSAFQITGPLPEEARSCVGKIHSENRAECCSKWGLGCARENEKCCTTHYSARKLGCEKGTACVLSDFGFSELDVPNSGRCRAVSAKQHACGVSICSRLGKEEICHVDGELTTCGAWGTRDRGSNAPSCDFECEECRDSSVTVYGSNGKKYCSTCHLEKGSCDSAFDFHGPVDQPQRPLLKPLSKDSKADEDTENEPVVVSPAQKPFKCTGEIAPHDVSSCCVEHEIGCIATGEECSSGGGMVPTAPCQSGNICVIADFGLASLDVPNSGICREVSPEQMDCSVSMCTRLGQEQLCKFNRSVTTCGSWGTPTHGHEGPDCSFECPTCLQRIARVRASDGSTYCSTCRLEKVSCSSHFRVFGPVGPDAPQLDEEEDMQDGEILFEPEASPEMLNDNKDS